jgi:acetoin utilization protein AcuB
MKALAATPRAPSYFPRKGTRAMKKTKVGDWMTPNPLTIDASATIVEAIHLLKERNIRRLPVMKNGRLAGIVTERMLLTFTPGKSTSLDTWELHYLLARTPVTEAMNPRPHTVTPETELVDAAQLIHDRKLNGITVVDERGELVGILTTTNLLEALIWFAKDYAQKNP